MASARPGTSGETDNSDTDDDTPVSDRIQRLVDYDTDDSDFSYSSDDDSDTCAVAPVWTISPSGMKQIEFVKEEKLLVPMPGVGKPMDYFRLLLDQDFIENIVKFTNEKAAEIYFSKPDLAPNSRIGNWKDVTIPEFLNFLGLLFHTGTLRLDRIQDYWKSDNLFRIHAFRSVMSRDRFQNILRCLSCQSPSHKDTSSLDQTMFIINYFNDKMLSVYYPDRELSIDEPMIFWRGRLFFRQHVKGTRHKYGVKLYTLRDQSGLILKFHAYTGPSDPIAGGKGHIEKVVLHLLKEKLNNGHTVSMDELYNSYSLCSKLLANDTYTTGVLRRDIKHLPEDVKKAVLKKGETVARYSENVMIGKWKDNREILYISTQFENVEIDLQTNKNTTVKKPLPVIQCSSYLSGLDRADQMLYYYPCERKNLIWDKKMFIHIMQMILLNAQILHNKFHRKMTFYDFRLEVISGLLPQLVTPPPIETPVQKRLRECAHTISKFERDELNRTKRKTCRMCWKNGKKTRKTPFFCTTCTDKPGLCMGKCFNEYHK